MLHYGNELLDCKNEEERVCEWKVGGVVIKPHHKKTSTVYSLVLLSLDW